jgi:hypothetical protein
MEDTKQAGGPQTADEKRRPRGFRVVTGILAVATAIGALWGAFTAISQAVELLNKRSVKAQPPPPPPQMLRTPRLGLQFWQSDARDIMQFDENAEPAIVTVLMKRGPFEIRFPKLKRDQALQLCAWKDASIFNITDGKPVKKIVFFIPGTGMADYEFGLGMLMLHNKAHNYLIGNRVEALSSSTDRVYFSQTGDVAASWATGGSVRKVPLTQQTDDIYLTAYVDKDKDKLVDYGEYEFVILHFQ